MSLGEIHIFARVQRYHCYVRTIASNSSPLQAFLYLYEKRRLETPETDDTAGGIGDKDNYNERLLGALIEDPRVAPFMLRGKRPKTAAECIQALRQWCHVPTTDGETLGRPDDLAAKADQRQELIVHGVCARSTCLLCEDIKGNGHRLTKGMRTRVSAREGTDDDALRRYLT